MEPGEKIIQYIPSTRDIKVQKFARFYKNSIKSDHFNVSIVFEKPTVFQLF